MINHFKAFWIGLIIIIGFFCISLNMVASPRTTSNYLKSDVHKHLEVPHLLDKIFNR
ncbi:hypothetical protein [Flammeovirga agarivorans]|uniref:Uncharacterized protein n=1 Tax=Flammeovirga agarivorans TaxID=2726742 RepID=A0A7X8SKR3_9BACT|nr:hypothetical protein [Flammeovirga agarivorans]NLR92024.1 hypothetical protein [Flammeovirga agarivorans]